METFLTSLAGFAAWLLRSSWQVSVLIALMLLAQWVFQKKLSPRWRYSLWLLVLLRLVLPVSPESAFSIFNYTQGVTGRKGHWPVPSGDPPNGTRRTIVTSSAAGTSTAPYMHNGNLATLDEVVEFYSRGGGPNPSLDREIRPLNLNADEKRELIEFLLSLSGNP